MIGNKSAIFWDWNGTLLDDTICCVEAMNTMRKKRGVDSITQGYYRSVFGFPVVNYYEELGFDFAKESFEDLSAEFISNYSDNMHLAKLQPGAKEVLSQFKEKGKSQIIVSAMEQTMLNQQIEDFELSNYFDDVCGISDIYANGKSHLAEQSILTHGLSPDQVLFVGDTLHDKEVAEHIGAELVLFSGGHQSTERLSLNGNEVIKELKYLLQFV
jgi:phosphoglycolate phosphatase